MRRVAGLLALAVVAACLLTQPAFPRVAAAQLAKPSPTSSPTPSPPPQPSDFSVGFQVNAVHTGAQPNDALKPRLARRWELDFGGAASYPLIADGMIYLTAAGADTSGHVALYALDRGTGRSVWGPAILPGTPPTNAAPTAYDAGRVFVLQGDALTGEVLSAFDSHKGSVAWSTRLPGQFFVQSAPTASNGTVYVLGQDSGPTLYAVSEASGNVLWSTQVSVGGQISPIVTETDIYVADSCNAYDLNPATGAQIWHYSGCSGGTGLNPVLYQGLLYVRSTDGTGIILNGGTGSQVGTFSAGAAPAFDGGLGFFLVGGRLEAHDLTSGSVTWTFTERDALGAQAGNDTLASAPVVANGYVYVASTQGFLFAIAEATGQAAWNDRIGVGFQSPDFAALGIGQGGLAAPFGNTLVFYTSAPSTTPLPQPSPGLDQARSYQLNPQHTGGQDADPLAFPLAKRWTAATAGPASFPLIAGGHVYFTDVYFTNRAVSTLYALNETDGSAAWGPVNLAQDSLLAYDNGAVFALGSGGALEAFDAATGAQKWSAQLPGSSFPSYPTASNGSLYVAATGELIAVSERSGKVLWSQSVLGSGDSSPIVTSNGVYIAYPCPEVYDFDPHQGKLIWHVGPTTCTTQAFGPHTAVLSNGRLYVRDSSTGLVLDAATGAQLGVFRSVTPPAFSGSMAFYVEGSSVEGWDLTTGSMVWRWDGDAVQQQNGGQLTYGRPSSPPVVVNGLVLFGFGSNAYALDGRTGRQIWSGAMDVATDVQLVSAGEGLVALAGGGAVTIYGSAGSVNPPSPTVSDEAVSHQIDAAHTGNQGSDQLMPPLAQRWSIDLGSTVSYPLIVGGRAFFAVRASPSSAGSVLHAVDLTTGSPVWGPVTLTGGAIATCDAILAADDGRLFVQENGVVHAFDAANGTELWSRSLGASCASPVASGGALFVGAMRLDEETAAQMWLRPVTLYPRLDAIAATDVYVDTGCEAVTDLAASDGTQAWTRVGQTCGSGLPVLEPALYGGRLYTQDFPASDPAPRAILDAGTGAQVNTYPSPATPAFAGSVAYYVVGGVLEAHNLPDLNLDWTFAGDGQLVTAPVVANGVVYVGSSNGNLYGVDAATGTQVWTASAGAALSAPDPVFALELTGLAVGEGWLLAPAGTQLVAYSNEASATSNARLGGVHP